MPRLLHHISVRYRTAPVQDRSQGQQPLSLHSSCPRVPVFGLKRGAFSQSALKRKPYPALERDCGKLDRYLVLIGVCVNR